MFAWENLLLKNLSCPYKVYRNNLSKYILIHMVKINEIGVTWHMPVGHFQNNRTSYCGKFEEVKFEKITLVRNLLKHL